MVVVVLLLLVVVLLLFVLALALVLLALLALVPMLVLRRYHHCMHGSAVQHGSCVTQLPRLDEGRHAYLSTVPKHTQCRRMVKRLPRLRRRAQPHHCRRPDRVGPRLGVLVPERHARRQMHDRRDVPAQRAPLTVAQAESRGVERTSDDADAILVDGQRVRLDGSSQPLQAVRCGRRVMQRARAICARSYLRGP